ncbi:DUF1330 domain-containing protein [Paracoccus bogoriensis]|uniref:DUF1330 domain-containing protein n=1 Tax=Paracoccus bogoriensis TaxID=242065 RepID=UPI001C6758FE|nr:DUF1330 domain-containing protein [Paracoccus bogoriensis]MBW7056556.1 DUF1330 domain-containing protein [Paracoccus bogoriensis]
MPKRHWIAHVTIDDPAAHDPCRAAKTAAFAGYGARFLQRAEPQEAVEGTARPRSVVIGFPGVKAARARYHGSAWPAGRVLRALVPVADVLIVEGCAVGGNGGR